MTLFEIDETTQKHLHNAFKGRFSWVYQRGVFSRVRFPVPPPNKNTNALLINVLAIFVFSFSRLIPEIIDFQTKNPAKSLDMGGFTLILVAKGNGTKIRIIFGLAKLHIRGSDVHDHFGLFPAGHMNNKVPWLNLVPHIGTIYDNVAPGLSHPEFCLDTGFPNQTIQDVIEGEPSQRSGKGFQSNLENESILAKTLVIRYLVDVFLCLRIGTETDCMI